MAGGAGEAATKSGLEGWMQSCGEARWLGVCWESAWPRLAMLCNPRSVSAGGLTATLALVPCLCPAPHQPAIAPHALTPLRLATFLAIRPTGPGQAGDQRQPGQGAGRARGAPAGGSRGLPPALPSLAGLLPSSRCHGGGRCTAPAPGQPVKRRTAARERAAADSRDGRDAGGFRWGRRCHRGAPCGRQAGDLGTMGACSLTPPPCPLLCLQLHAQAHRPRPGLVYHCPACLPALPSSRCAVLPFCGNNLQSSSWFACLQDS